MTIGASVFLVALGAVLRYAVNLESSTIDLDVVGLIFMIAGAAGLVLGLFLYATGSQRTGRVRERVIEDNPPL